jgi:uncharacterized membrane protein (UPF0127 family)
MRFYEIEIQGEKFNMAIAADDESRTKGLSGLSKLGKNKGMLFLFPEKQNINLIMDDMTFALDFLFLDDNWKVTQYGSRGAKDAGITSMEECKMAIEIPFGTIERLEIEVGTQLEASELAQTQAKGVQKFKHGGEFEMHNETIYALKEGGRTPEKGTVQLLDEEGKVVLNLGKKTRVFSREHTSTLLELSGKKDDEELAEFMMKVLDKQDSQEQEYT